MDRKKVSVLVAGSWGTTLATVLANNEHDVYIWTRNEHQAAEINRFHKNEKYLPGVKLPTNLVATTSIEQAVTDAQLIVIAAPSSSMRDVAQQLRPFVHERAVIVHATKGFEKATQKRMSEVIADELPDYASERISVLSGPSHAEEVVRRSPTTVVVAAADHSAAEIVQQMFINSYFRVYTNTDVVGVEVGGALKNIIAIGGGLSDGLQFGDNAKAALITRGLAEISRLGVAMGANPLTFAGLAGIGDLIVTCTSRHSRNWRAGYMLAEGKPLDEVLESMGMVVEGVRTTRSAFELAEKHEVEMPITEQLMQVLFHQKKPLTAVEDLMGRGRTQEETYHSAWP